jgi:hypothetical protein
MAVHPFPGTDRVDGKEIATKTQRHKEKSWCLGALVAKKEK